jgi:hypothetical protein
MARGLVRDLVEVGATPLGVDGRRLGDNMVEGVVVPQAFLLENRPKFPVKTLETALSKMGENVEDRPTAIDFVPG